MQKEASYEHNFWKDLAAFLFFVALAVATTWPLAQYAGSRVPGNLIDPLLVVSIVGWQSRAIFNSPGDLFDAPYFHPEQGSLLLSEQLFGGSLLGLPFWLATQNSMLAANAMTILTFAFAAFGAYLLIRDVTGSRLAGCVAGIVFAFSAFRLTRLWAPHVLLTMWLPFILVYLRRFVNEPKMRNGLGLALFLFLQVASSGHGALMAAVVLPIAAIVLILRSPSVLSSSRFWITGSVSVLVFAVAAAPFVLPYQRLYAGHPEFERDVTEVEAFSGGYEGFLTASTDNLLYGESINELAGDPTQYEKVLFPGAFLVLLAFAGLILSLAFPKQRETRRWALLFAVLAVFGATMSVGIKDEIEYPFGFFHKFFPGFDRVRVPGRFAIVTTLGLAGLAGLAIAFFRKTETAVESQEPDLWEHSYGSRERDPEARPFGWGPQTRIGPPKRAPFFILAFTSMALLLAESWVKPTMMLEPPKPSLAYRWLADQPENTAVLELPTGVPDDASPHGVFHITLTNEALYLHTLTLHWRPITNGYAGNVPASYVETTRAVLHFPDKESADYLEGLGVRYVIVHRNRLKGLPWENVESQVRSLGTGLILLDFPDSFVVDVDRLLKALESRESRLGTRG